jgi:hypothetical protein
MDHEHVVHDDIPPLFGEANARRHLHEFWLRDCECWAFVDGFERRLDEETRPCLRNASGSCGSVDESASRRTCGHDAYSLRAGRQTVELKCSDHFYVQDAWPRPFSKKDVVF